MSALSSPRRSLPPELIVPRIVSAREYSARLVAARGHAAHHVAVAGGDRPSGERALRRAGTLTRSSRNVGWGSFPAVPAGERRGRSTSISGLPSCEPEQAYLVIRHPPAG